MIHRLRTVFAALFLVSLVACSGGVNAGVKGGTAFIVFTVMLLVTLGILWAVLGREK